MKEKEMEEQKAEANKKRNIEELLKPMGSAKGAEDFVRDRRDRY